MKLKKPIAKFNKKDYPFVLDHSIEGIRKANSMDRVYMTNEARKKIFPMVDKVFKLIAKVVKK